MASAARSWMTLLSITQLGCPDLCMSQRRDRERESQEENDNVEGCSSCTLKKKRTKCGGRRKMVNYRVRNDEKDSERFSL